MIKSQRGAANGIDIVEYKAGETYDLPAIFYDRWIERGLCEPFVEEIISEVEEIPEVKEIIEEVKEKMFIPEIENKMIEPVEENKLEKLRGMKIVGVSNKKLAEQLGVSINELKELKKQLKA